jgi:hypothetical protein
MRVVYGLAAVAGGIPELTSGQVSVHCDSMTDQTTTPRSGSARRSGVTPWRHVCERCGETMEERKCKIICPNCGLCRDCSDP